MTKSYRMNFSSAIFFAVLAAAALAGDCPAKKTTSKLVCYYSKLTHVDSCRCTHVVLPESADVKAIDRIREHVKGVKILITVNEFNQGLVNILKSSKVDGIEINLKKLDSKNDISDFISTVRSKLGSDLYIALSVPAKAENLAKYYDFKSLSKNADLFILQTAFLGASKNVTFHPSRLSGLWDMQNTDSVVDLVSGLGAPLSKLVITAPVQAFRFKLQSEKHTAPGSPALEVQSVTRDELCTIMGNGGNWTLERDQDQAGPYIFSDDQWIAFDDPTSIDIKAKYARVRGLAGMALKDLSQDGGSKCESTILDAAYNGLSRQARAPRGAVLHSLEREILETPVRPLDSIQVSPYRISRVIDVEGNVHVIRKDTRTEFECSRQGYFVHPRSCGRFYRCVKFDQLSDEFSVFEFDCPAGLAFDSRVEVCVWPGSLPHASPCSGSSEIAPVPRERFICPTEPGYYADPENCRWFFACLDHGKSPLSAYEFRCPFGLVYDESRLLCEWPWLVPKCASGYAVGSQVVYGGAVALDQYDGLGVLGVTALGGLHGPLQQPVAKIYSNVGLVSQGDGYLTGNGQLSLKSAQSLQNAGLLRGGYSAGSLQGSGLGYTTGSIGSAGYSAGSVQGSGLSYTTGSVGSSGSVQGSGLAYTTGSIGSAGSVQGSGLGYTTGSTGSAGSVQGSGLAYTTGSIGSAGSVQGSGLGYTTGSIGSAGLQTTQLGGAGLVYTQGHSDSQSANSQGTGFGVRLHQIGGSGLIKSQGQDFTLHTAGHGGGYTHLTDASLLNTGLYQGNVVASDLQSNYVDHSANLNYQTGAGGRTGGAAVVGVQSIGTTNAHLVNGLADNLQYKTGTIVTNANVNANGAVVSGYDNAKSTVEYHGNTGSSYGSGVSGETSIVGGGYSAVGVSSGGVELTGYGEGSDTVTHVTQSPVAVASVSSIPAVTSVPVPSLKVASGFQSFKGGVVANVPELQYKVQTNLASSHGSTGFANISGSYVNYVSSTPSTLLEQDGYHYVKPTVAFVEEPIKTTYQKTASVGTAFVQQNLASVHPVVTAYQKPVIVSTTQTPLVVEKVNVGTYQQPISTSFVQHVQPVVSTYEKAAVAVQTPLVEERVNVQPVVTTYQKPVSTSFVQHVQPVVTTYEKPVVSVQTPIIEQKVNVQPVVTTYQKPVVVSTTQAPVVVENIHIQPIQKQQTTFSGYDYPKPAIKFEETPVKAVGGSFSYQNVDLLQKTYATPTVVQTVQPVVQVQPTLQTVVQPVVKQQPAVTFTTFQKQPQLEVTSYNVPSSTVRPVVVEQPQVYVSSTPATIVQPAVKQQAAVFTNFQRHEVVQPQLQVTSYNVPSSTVRPVVVQQPQVYVSSTPATIVQPAVKQQAAVSFTNFQRHEVVQPQLQVTSYSVPSSTVRPVVVEQPQVYVSSTPATVPVVQQQAVTFQKHETVQPQLQVTSYNVPSSTITPIVQQKVAQPAVVSSFSISSNTGGYHYEKPSIAFEERPSVVTYQQPAVQKTVITSQPVATFNYQAPVQVKPVSTYSYKNVLQSAVSQGYDYPKPAVAFEEVPASVTRLQTPAVVSSFSYSAPSTVKPAVVVQKQTPVVSTYTYTAPSTVKPAVVVQQQPVVTSYTYTPSTVKPAVYVQPIVSSTPKSAIFLQKQPAVVNTYSYTAPSTVRPAIVAEPVITYTPRPVVVKKRPTVVSSYSFGSQEKAAEFAGYDYPKPVVPFVEQPSVVTSYENRQPVEEVPFVAKKAYVTGNEGGSYQYTQQFSNVNLEQKPLVVENYQAPIQPVVSTTPVYQYQQPVVSSTPRYEVRQQQYSVDSGYVYEKPAVAFEEKPLVVESYRAPVSRTGTSGSYYIDNRPNTVQKFVSTTSRPIVDYTYVQSTPKPTLLSTINTVVATKQPFTFYDSRITSTARPVTYSTARPVTYSTVAPVTYSTAVPVVQTVTTSRPISRYSFSSLDDQYQQVNYVAPVEVTTASRGLPVKVDVTTSRPITKFAFSSLDTQYQQNANLGRVVENYVAPIEVTTPARDYLPVAVTTSAPTTAYVAPVRVTTSAPALPAREYLPVRSRVRVTTSAPEVTTLSREYLPVRSRTRVTSTPVPTDDYEVVSSRRPVEVVRVSRPKTIVKVNDFHPLLSAKLGAQCTCVSNSIKLRKKPVRIIVEEDDDDDDGYVVDDGNQGVVADGNQGVVVENYQYEPQKIVEITPTPEVYIKSTTSTVDPSPTPVYSVRRRVRVRPATSTVVYDAPVTQAAEVFLRKAVTPASADAVVVDAVSNDLSEGRDTSGDKVSLQSGKFDRYGPGGWRSRNEKLQGTIDCQRAGLFRHPTQCNKFYACRWDCTKNRYTLHVFNCPVHLTFDNNLGACNWPSQGPACLENTLLPSD